MSKVLKEPPTDFEEEMALSSPKPSTATDSSSTMNDHHQSTFLWCKSKFEEALHLFRSGCGELVSPHFGDGRFEQQTLRNIKLIHNRSANAELAQLYFLALDRKTNETPSDSRK